MPDHGMPDIRYDEDYARFYEVYSGQKKLPPPVEGHTLYQELPGLFQHARLGGHQGLMPGAHGGPNPQMLVRPGAKKQQASACRRSKTT